MQGRSLRPLLQGQTPGDWRTSMYYHYYEYPAVHSVKRHYGVRTQRYKLIHFYNDIDEWELYDLKKDPDELKNVYSDPEYADVVKELTAELKRLRAQVQGHDRRPGVMPRRENTLGDHINTANVIARTQRRSNSTPGEGDCFAALAMTCQSTALE